MRTIKNSRPSQRCQFARVEPLEHRTLFSDTLSDFTGSVSLAGTYPGFPSVAPAVAVGHSVLLPPRFSNPQIVEVYHIRSRTFSEYSVPNNAYSQAPAVVGHLGLFAGSSGNPTRQVEIYDDSTRKWSTASLSLARGDMSSGTVEGKVLFAGGFTRYGNFGSHGAPVNTVDIFDSAAGLWSATTMPVANADQGTASWRSRVVFAGDGGAYPGGNDASVFQVYNAASNQWISGTLPAPILNPIVVQTGRKAVFVDGYSGAAEIYDFDTGAWSIAPQMQKRPFAAAVAVGTSAYIAGGIYTDHLGIAHPSQAVAVFDSTSNAWSTLTLPHPANALVAAAVGNKPVFVGDDHLAQIYDSGAGTWSTQSLSGTETQNIALTTPVGAIVAGQAIRGTKSRLVIDDLRAA